MTVNNTLGPAPVRSEAPGEILSAERARVLEDLQHRIEPPTSAEVGRSLGLHTNTARLHLEALVERGLAKRFSAAPNGRGRPALRYDAVLARTEPDRRVRDLVGLARALSSYLQRTSPNPAAQARAVGVQWAASFDPTSTTPTDRSTDPVEFAITRLDHLGFEPIDKGSKATYRLRRCPLLDVARNNPEVVCNVHLGLVRGTLAQLGATHLVADLQPFAEPGACLLTFKPTVQ